MIDKNQDDQDKTYIFDFQHNFPKCSNKVDIFSNDLKKIKITLEFSDYSEIFSMFSCQATHWTVISHSDWLTHSLTNS